MYIAVGSIAKLKKKKKKIENDVEISQPMEKKKGYKGAYSRDFIQDT